MAVSFDKMIVYTFYASVLDKKPLKAHELNTHTFFSFLYDNEANTHSLHQTFLKHVKISMLKLQKIYNLKEHHNIRRDLHVC